MVHPRIGNPCRWLALVSVVLVTHCSDAQPTTPSLTAEAISITGDRPLIEGESTTLSATVKWSDGSSRVVTDGVSWSSEDPSIASVSSQGVVLGRAAGTTRVRAAFNALSSATPLTVTAGARRVTGRVHESAPTENVTIGGAAIAAIDAGGTTYSTTADAAGSFVLDMRPGSARVTVTARGYESLQSSVEVGPAGSTVSLALVPEFREVRLSFPTVPSFPHPMIRQRTYRLDVHHAGVIDARYVDTYSSASGQAFTCLEIRDAANNTLVASRGFYDSWSPNLRLDVQAGQSYEVKFFICEPAPDTVTLAAWGGEIKFPR